jgi:adenosine kinase
MVQNILISGSLVYDRIMDFPGKFSDHILPEKIHILNVAFPIEKMEENFGGTAGNIAYNLSLLGESPYILTCVGKDFSAYEKWLLKNKIKISEIKKLKNKYTAGAYIMTDKADNQITGFNGAAMNIPRGKVKSGILKNSIAIVSPGNIQDMADYPNLYKQKKVRYIFDPGQAIPGLNKKALISGLSGAEILIGNDYEIEMIKKKIGWPEKKLITKIKILIITKGEKGSVIYAQGKKIIIKACRPRKVIDPTGAGDAYRAGVIKGLLLNWDFKKIGQFASAVASFAVEKYGAQKHRFNMREVERRIKV